MITVIHGSDITASRNYLHEEKIKYKEKIILSPSATVTDIMQVFSPNKLFGEMQTVFLEEFLTQKKSQKEIDVIASFLLKQKQTNIFLWEGKELTKKQLALFPAVTVKAFAVPRIVFTFLDGILPQNTKKTISLYHQVLQHEDAPYVLFMLMRQVRLVLAVCDKTIAEITEVKRLAPWQLSKLKKQANAFTQDQLLALHEKLFQLELGQKTGGLVMSLEKELDLFLLSF
ncbi:MAG TPA: hypothetical protein VGT05_03860 [Patescibacteria group bacterium]|nr:hypothetical protein [Patescibacteria group bacterium]